MLGTTAAPYGASRTGRPTCTERKPSMDRDPRYPTANAGLINRRNIPVSLVALESESTTRSIEGSFDVRVRRVKGFFGPGRLLEEVLEGLCPARFSARRVNPRAGWVSRG